MMEVVLNFKATLEIRLRDPAHVYEWWVVSEDFAFRAKEAGEIIIEMPYCTLWGRQTTGITLVYDPSCNRHITGYADVRLSVVAE